MPPEIFGSVIEQQTSLPVKNARVNLQIMDSLADPELHLPLSSYLQMIGTVPGQSVINGILSTVTDSLGRFSFRLLPAGTVLIAVIAPRFEIAHALMEVRDGTSKKLVCRLIPFDKDSALEIVVYGKPVPQQRIDIEDELVATGLTHYLSDVLRTKAEIRAVPESKSMMMVRAGSPTAVIERSTSAPTSLFTDFNPVRWLSQYH